MVEREKIPKKVIRAITIGAITLGGTVALGGVIGRVSQDSGCEGKTFYLDGDGKKDVTVCTSEKGGIIIQTRDDEPHRLSRDGCIYRIRQLSDNMIIYLNHDSDHITLSTLNLETGEKHKHDINTAQVLPLCAE